MTQAATKTCDDFGPEEECCTACHQLEKQGVEELMVIRRSDGSVYAKVCCEMSEDAMAALAEEESNSD
jgi:hypothetical protein